MCPFSECQSFTLLLCVRVRVRACVRACAGWGVARLSRVQLFAITWIAACQTPLSMEFSRQESWSGLPFPAPEDFPDSGIEPASRVFPAAAGRFFIAAALGKQQSWT